MKNAFITKSSADFIAKLSPLERALFDSFSSCQRNADLGTFCVFREKTGPNMNFMAVPSDSPLAAHIEWNMQEDNQRYNALLVALDLNRSFQSQWPCEPGKLSQLDRFADRQLICATGLENCKAVDQKNAIGDGLRRSVIRLVSSTNEPRAFSFGTKTRPALRLVEGCRP
ncbi:MAG: hypothetical protein ACXW30_03260 [Micavibrio sp.]